MKKYYIGVDIGGTNTRVALLNKRFEIFKKISFSTSRYKKPSRLLRSSPFGAVPSNEYFSLLNEAPP